MTEPQPHAETPPAAATPRPALRRPDAVALLSRHGAAFMRTARRYAPSQDDAEDAYQRSVEILLTKAPDIPEHELVPWMKTVIKHEAFAIARHRDRAHLGTAACFDGETAPEAPVLTVAGPEERAEQIERLRLGAEAMGRLKPQEVRCLTLLAEGYSYKQIQEITGFSYTKVNRCLAEGRQRFLERVAGIESGAECRGLQPKLSLLADGRATPEDLALLRPHLRSCLSCRATLREFREAPARVAALVPPVLGLGPLAGALERTLGAVREWLSAHGAAAGAKARAAAEVLAVPKAAATAAVVVVAAGGAGGVAISSAGPESSAAASLPKAAAAPPVVERIDDGTRRGADRPRATAPRRHRVRPQRTPPRPRTPPQRRAAATAQAAPAPAPASAPATREAPPVAAPAPAPGSPRREAPAPSSEGGEFGP